MIYKCNFPNSYVYIKTSTNWCWITQYCRLSCGVKWNLSCIRVFHYVSIFWQFVQYGEALFLQSDCNYYFKPMNLVTWLSIILIITNIKSIMLMLMCGDIKLDNYVFSIKKLDNAIITSCWTESPIGFSEWGKSLKPMEHYGNMYYIISTLFIVIFAIISFLHDMGYTKFNFDEFIHFQKLGGWITTKNSTVIIVLFGKNDWSNKKKKKKNK